jgi:hypothetical protein
MHYSDVQCSHRERIQKFKKLERLHDFSNIRDVEKFENQNYHKNFSLTVFGINNEEQVLLKYLSKFTTDKKSLVVNLVCKRRY